MLNTLSAPNAPVTGIVLVWTEEDWQAGRAWNVGLSWNGEEATKVYLGGWDAPAIPYTKATDAEAEAYKSWKANQDKRRAEYASAKAEDEFLTKPVRGEVVRVKTKAKGRQVKNAGRSGKFVKQGMSDYGAWVLLEENGETFFSKPEYLEVLHPAFDEWVTASY